MQEKTSSPTSEVDFFALYLEVLERISQTGQVSAHVIVARK